MSLSFLRTLAGASLMLFGSFEVSVGADRQTCRTIRLSDPGWVDVAVTNALASVLLNGLGYTVEISTQSLPVGYEMLKSGKVDVFLGNWMPAQRRFVGELTRDGAIEVLTRNLVGAKLTLAVPDYVAKMGVKDFADLQEHADAFDRKIYGVDVGAAVNENIEEMIGAGSFGLGDWEVIASSEQGMLSQVERAERKERAIVFIGWAPHPMNERFNMTYLSGGDAFFGERSGGAEVFTLARSGWAEMCPNAAAFFRKLVFDVGMENVLLGRILDGEEPTSAASSWLKRNPAIVESWLDGITTLDGASGAHALRTALRL